ncbi:cytochrome oxidase assembly protein ShyY1 [Planotetraspora sp. GP83]
MDKPTGGRTLALILLAMVAMFAVIIGLAVWAAG